jgi:lysophospholipase L1-like esterase
MQETIGMNRFHRKPRALLGACLALVVGSCSDFNNGDVLGPRPSGVNSIFQSYVALGNSITAGYQSSGITDSTQRRSYAFLLAQQMGTRFAYPSMANPGCPPLINNFQTQTRVGNATSTTCFLRANSTDILNNVAVPGASSFDPMDPDGTAFSNTLTSFFLGGESQVQRALDASPTFASIWIGNNDVLGFAVADGRTSAPTGLAGMTATATFTANYDAMLNALLAGAPDLEGVLVGVVQVANAPIMFPAAAMSSPTFKAGFDAIANTTTTLDPSCTAAGAGATSLINTFLAFQIRLGAHPAVVACVPGGASGAIPAPVGDILVLDPTEQGTLSTRISEYNTYIQNKANELGWAYWDPNPTLATLRAGNTVVRNVPTLGATGTFGTGMSLDGVHPGAPIHRTIANELITAINAKYSTTLVAVP